MKKTAFHRHQKFVVLLLCLIVMLFSQASAATFYVIRHAEKQLGDDPELTDQGLQRAQRIADLLITTDIQVIYSTNYRRTQATAKPLANVKKLPVVTYDPGDLDNFAKQLLKDNRNAVIIGHSNTTPDLVRLLSLQMVPDMDEATFHLIYQVVTFPDMNESKAVVNIFSSE